MFSRRMALANSERRNQSLQNDAGARRWKKQNNVNRPGASELRR